MSLCGRLNGPIPASQCDVTVPHRQLRSVVGSDIHNIITTRLPRAAVPTRHDSVLQACYRSRRVHAIRPQALTGRGPRLIARGHVVFRQQHLAHAAVQRHGARHAAVAIVGPWAAEEQAAVPQQGGDLVWGGAGRAGTGAQGAHILPKGECDRGQDSVPRNVTTRYLRNHNISR